MHLLRYLKENDTKVKIHYKINMWKAWLKYAKCTKFNSLNLFMLNEVCFLLKIVLVIYNVKLLSKLQVLIDHSIVDIIIKALNKVVYWSYMKVVILLFVLTNVTILKRQLHSVAIWQRQRPFNRWFIQMVQRSKVKITNAKWKTIIAILQIGVIFNKLA